MKAVVKRVEFPAGRRILAVSDIHGNLPWFRALLDKAGYTGDDILVLVGDLVEKGADSLATLRYIMELSAAHTVYALCGNCDNLAVDFAYGGGELGRDFYRFYLSVWRDRALILQMAASRAPGGGPGGPCPDCGKGCWSPSGPSWRSCGTCPPFWRPGTSSLSTAGCPPTRPWRSWTPGGA